ncbi:glycosyl transferase [Nostocoides sp. HKS02]|uniref:glycosyl transferase n=1 Tax=Nostocoides sp. HKS02 TaxID=1813880 RepID=UPI0012B4CC9F|nr:glycosyl transferase [Tetrasphaera sp. HKS02]QGN57946.1 glycosyl transferase [Tetrasphaera sp. HKS02]
MAELVTSLIVTLAFSPVIRAAMLRHGVIDVPNHRSSHSLPTPRGGGWACVAGVLAAAGVAAWRHTDVPLAALAAALVLALVGFADDRSDLSAGARLTAQILAGLAVGGVTGGIAVALVGAVLYPTAVNVVNFMDGINGITALTMAVWGVTAIAVGVTDHVPGVWVIGAATAGAALGFLPWNAPRARLFLGDVGSYLFGALVAGGILLGWHGGARVSVLAAPLCFYVADTFVTLAQRATRREPLLSAHRDHVYQRMVRVVGLSHTVTALSVACASALVTAAWVWADVRIASLFSVVSVLLYVGCVRLAGAARGTTSDT